MAGRFQSHSRIAHKSDAALNSMPDFKALRKQSQIICRTFEPPEELFPVISTYLHLDFGMISPWHGAVQVPCGAEASRGGRVHGRGVAPEELAGEDRHGQLEDTRSRVSMALSRILGCFKAFW